MTLYVVKKNKDKEAKPYTVVLKKGFAKEGQQFDSNQVLCGDQQLETILAEEPCRIEKVKVKPAKAKSKDKGKNK